MESRFAAAQLHYCCRLSDTGSVRPTRPAPDVSAEAAKLAETTGDPSLATLGVRYGRALLRWGKAGFPVRSDEEVAAIVALCQQMTLPVKQKDGSETSRPCYDAEEGRCRLCGCRADTRRMAVINKAKMATEHCPRGLW